MPRKARVDIAGALHHIIVRGIEQSVIFKDDLDRNRFIDRLASVITEGQASCYAWSLLSNHVHLLLRTGATSLAGMMRRLLTGYAVSFNKRHKRSGHLLQNRYTSILCEEEPYFLELIRYIHLNPIRAHIVEDMSGLDKYPFSGHATLMGKKKRLWQDTDSVLRCFGEKQRTARERYRDFLEKGIAQGHRNDLIGGGISRSYQGWRPSRKEHSLKGDERILGSSSFVLDVLRQAEETWEYKQRLHAEGIDFDFVLQKVSVLFGLTPEEILSPGKYRNRVMARRVLCYISVRHLGTTATALATKLRLSQPAISMAVARGEHIMKERGIDIISGLPGGSE